MHVICNMYTTVAKISPSVQMVVICNIVTGNCTLVYDLPLCGFTIIFCIISSFYILVSNVCLVADLPLTFPSGLPTG